MKKVLILIIIVLIAGCSSRAAYENFQINKRNECLRLPQAQYDECMQSMDKSFDEYEKQRQEAIKSEAESK